MSVRSQLEKALSETEDKHAKNQAIYHKARKAADNQNQKARDACTAASRTANELAALRKAVNDLPPEPEEEAA